jgi:Na+/H+-dicarboxylate symporter
MKRIALHWQILIAIILGCAFGYWLPNQVGYVSWIGDLFIRLLKMVVIPLIFCSLVAAITGIRGGEKLGRLGGKAVALYVLTTLLAVLLGLFLVNLIRPGAGMNISDKNAVAAPSLQSKSLRDTLLASVPENPFADLANANMLPIVVFAIVFGIFLARTRSESEDRNLTPTDDPHTLSGQTVFSSVETLIRCFEGGFDVMMKMTTFLLAFAPLGVFGLIAANVAKFGGESEAFAQFGQGLGLHFLVVFSGLLIHLVCTLSLCIWLFSGCNPWKHLSNMGAVILTAFSTASSNGTLPLTIRDTVEKDGVSKETAGFVLPLGATVNMNGTALYECAVVLFVAQAYGVELSLYQQFVTVLLVLLTAIGTAGIPMASLVMIVIVLTAVGLPPEGIGLVIAVDRPLDMCRTAVNVYGDTCCAVIVAKSEGEQLNV